MITKGNQSSSSETAFQTVAGHIATFGLKGLEDGKPFYPDFVVPIMRIVGSFCNLRCKYCFFREDDQGTPEHMSVEVLKRAIEEVVKYNTSRGYSTVEFIWHGGEPLLAGKDFFKEIITIQSAFPNVEFVNGIQTNATLIDEDWARFFLEHRFQVGVSLDGLPILHDRYRVNVGGRGSWNEAIRGYESLRRVGLSPGIIVVVHAESIPLARDIVKYLYYDLEARNIAFNPFFDPRHPLGVTPLAFRSFLQEALEVWLEIGNPDFQIREVDEFLNLSQGIPPRGCTFNGKCFHHVSIQPNGDVYACNRLPFVPSLQFGNVLHESLTETFASRNYQQFVLDVMNFPQECRDCPLLQLCHNGCTAHRLRGKYYYCAVRREMPAWINQRLGVVLESIMKGGTLDEHE